MSQENVDFVRQSIRRFADRDFEGLREDYSPDAVLHAPTGWPDGAVFSGRDTIIKQFVRLQEDWRQQNMIIPRIDGYGDWVIAGLVWEAAGAGSGIPTQMSLVGAYRVEAGRIAEARFFWDRDKPAKPPGCGSRASRSPHWAPDGSWCPNQPKGSPFPGNPAPYA